MKRNYLYALSLALVMGACADHDVVGEAAPADKPQTEIPSDAIEGELLIKFAPEMSGILDRAKAATRAKGGIATRSGIPSTDEVLDILGAYHFERVFPVNERTEDKARRAGLHLWYRVKFDKDTDLREAYARISRLGEVSKLQVNSHIYRTHKPARPARLLSDATLKAVAATRAEAAMPFDDPRLQYQWHLINSGSTDICMENEEGKKNLGKG